MNTSEIYLTKKNITPEEWQEFIKTISNLNGHLKKWKIIITKEKNQIHYFVKTKYALPPTLNNLNAFLLKETKSVELPAFSTSLYPLFTIGGNLIDILNKAEIKKKGEFIYLETTFKKITEEKIISKTFYCLKKQDTIKKYKLIPSLPSNVLSVDFEGNKRYFYKGAPTYLDVQKILHLLNTDQSASLLKVDTFPYLQGNFYIKQNSYNFAKHSIIIGSSGSGKSKFISQLISNINKNIDTKQKYKIVVIDPHAALEKEFGGISKIIDFKSTNHSMNLFLNKKEDVISSSELLLELLKSLINDQYNSKLERVLRHSIHLLLIDESFNFENLRKLILEIEYRNELIKKNKNNLPDSVIDFFLTDFNNLKTTAYGEAISPIISFIDEMEMMPVLSKENNQSNLKECIQDNFITLFSLDRTKLGNKITKTLSGLIMQQLLTIIQSYEITEQLIFVIDEVAVVENPILARFLSEARKYNLSLILIGQYLNQISDSLKDAIFANTVNYYIFRTSKLDASLLVENLQMKIPLDDSKEKKIQVLTELATRECIVRINKDGMLLPAFKAKTLDYQSIPRKIEKKIDNEQTQEKPTTRISKFKIEDNISLKNILIKNSSGRKELK